MKIDVLPIALPAPALDFLLRQLKTAAEPGQPQVPFLPQQQVATPLRHLRSSSSHHLPDHSPPQYMVPAAMGVAAADDDLVA